MSTGYVYRSWWRGRTLRLAAALVLLVLFVRLWWGWKSSSLLAAQLSAIRARGEPASVEDFVVVNVPDAQNAYEYQMQAAGAHVAGVDSPRNSNLEYPEYPPYTPEWHQLAELSEQKHQKVFALARQARQFQLVQTHERYKKPLFNVLLPGLNRARNLANTLADGAVHQHLKGNDAEAIERIRDILHLSRSIRQDDFLVSQLVAMGIDALAMNATMTIAPAIEVDSKPGSAKREQVKQLIAQLLDEREAWEGFTRGIKGERVYEMDYADYLTQGTWVVKPMVEMQDTRSNRRFDDVLTDIQKRTYPDALPAFQAYSAQAQRDSFTSYDRMQGRYSRFFGNYFSSIDRYSRTAFRNLAERRMTAVSLAVRLYRIDNGAWPAKLQDLVPHYLPALPQDPFRSEGQPIGYKIVRGTLPDGGDRPLLFVEEGPELARALLREPMYSWVRDPGPPPLKESVRQYRDLSRFVPPPLPSETVDDDPKKPGTPGEQPQQNDQPREP